MNNMYGMMLCMYCIIFSIWHEHNRLTAYHLGQYSLHLLLLKGSVAKLHWTRKCLKTRLCVNALKTQLSERNFPKNIFVVDIFLFKLTRTSPIDLNVDASKWRSKRTSLATWGSSIAHTWISLLNWFKTPNLPYCSSPTSTKVHGGVVYPVASLINPLRLYEVATRDQYYKPNSATIQLPLNTAIFDALFRH